ncbi:vesicular integral-membrane protein VIP36-like [Biomphalaria glabrata]|uniref:Vesicular integral-membrane protein VIP36-like n=1 Tax=Biomphalaria glabrata TaxID=6526 RepID=A0A9W2Z7F3_BIOGL|nr:vesicular integral-membrane protein VIP36-like [Biomphalaria glabrata]KAI8777721.1 vesicular integral-membrane protein VIP36 isoform X1 [Biomphalaria glabrata]
MAVHVLCFFIWTFLLIFVICVDGEWNTKDFQRREHSLIKPYQGSGMNVPQWDFLGSTMVTNNYIRLTPDRQSKMGAIWNNVPCIVRSWELHIQFKVHGSGKSLFGDGFAVWYTKDRMIAGSIFGNSDPFTGLGIFLDTYSNHNGPHNHNHPYISAMVSNGSLKYDHDTDGTHTQLAGCEAQFRNKNYETYLAVRYDGNTEQLTVSTDIDNKSGWKECFSVNGIKLPLGYFFGVSAATGDLADNHDIISIKFYDLDTEESKKSSSYYGLPEAKSMEAPRDRIDDSKGSYLLENLTGWKLLVIILLLVIGIGVCVMVGLIIFQKQQENSRKRFY